MTLTELFDKPDAIELVDAELRKLAAENPDFVYNPKYGEPVGYYYSKGPKGGPECGGCIFGQALQRLGVDMAELDESLDKTSEDSAIDDIVPVVDDIGNWTAVQNAQDHGESWGEAIKKL